jgi:putative phosphoribosyl transferase
MARAVEQSVRIPPLGLPGDLVLPPQPKGFVIFVHGSGSSRHSPRNRHVAAIIQEAGFGTLLFDLLTEAEEDIDVRTRQLRFDIGLLAARLQDTTDWFRELPASSGFPMGYFGASTGGGAALVAAAARPGIIGAVVARGGRPDLCGPALRRVAVPTLLIVGGEDKPVIQLNQQAVAQMQCEKQLAIVPGATHLFEEPGALEQVSALAVDWFRRHLTQPAQPDIKAP